MIEFRNVTRKYGQKVAVDGLSLTVPPGELFAFLGPNGAGKTTTIKMLVGLLRPDAGDVKVCGYDALTQPRLAARCIGYVPDEPFLYDKLSGREFLEFAAEMRGLAAAVIPERVARETDRFQLAEFLDQMIETYSHGMRQRLVFASALLHDPAVVVIDEPTVGLDPRSVRLVKDLLRTLAAAGRAIFMSTHILAVAEEIADRIGIVDRGRLHFVGTMSDLRQKMSSPQASLERFFLELTDGANGRGDPAALSREHPGPVLPST
jgi:ABC-2 type transport system ATP-binding protein